MTAGVVHRVLLRRIGGIPYLQLDDWWGIDGLAVYIGCISVCWPGSASNVITPFSFVPATLARSGA